MEKISRGVAGIFCKIIATIHNSETCSPCLCTVRSQGKRQTGCIHIQRFGDDRLLCCYRLKPKGAQTLAVVVWGLALLLSQVGVLTPVSAGSSTVSEPNQKTRQCWTLSY